MSFSLKIEAQHFRIFEPAQSSNDCNTGFVPVLCKIHTYRLVQPTALMILRDGLLGYGISGGIFAAWRFSHFSQC